jgi:hypothetical protein
MTCIVGMTVADGVLLGADSAAAAGWDLTTRVAPKVFVNGPMVMGFTDSFRMGDLLEHVLVVPERPFGVTVDRFLRTTFIDAVRACLADGGLAKKENGVEEGGQFLVGYEGRLFFIGSNYQVGENDQGYHAIGCGAAYALGALAAQARLVSMRSSFLERIEVALDVAGQFSAGVREPYRVVRGGDVSQREDAA